MQIVGGGVLICVAGGSYRRKRQGQGQADGGKKAALRLR